MPIKAEDNSLILLQAYLGFSSYIFVQLNLFCF